MKKLGLLAMAFALVLGLSQCKKENTAGSNDDGIKVPITLNVSGNSGSRVTVTPETGVVTFENGDVIHVVSNGTYVGTLTYNGTQFSGEINEPTEGQKLQFYFLGNITPEFNTDNTGCSVVISDQTEYLPVISYAPSRENYQVGKTDYNATLLNKCALVKFDVTTASEAATCILGMNNKVTVNFTTNEFTYGQDDEGIVTLAAGNGEKWAILLPQDEVTEAQAQASDGSYTGTCGTIPSIAENDYLTEGIAVAIETAAGPVGIIDGAFTINANGDQVYFSQGNLQNQASTNTWQFAEHQYDYVGDANSNISSTYSGWIDLFGWGTSGYNHGAVCYQPWSTDNSYGGYYYAYGQQNYNLYDQTGQADWGYNAISNGDNAENSGWRTLTAGEWRYVFSLRADADSKFGQGNVNGVNGMMLLPDDWTVPEGLSFTAGNNSWTANVYDAGQWAQMEVNGAVFLPAAGDRSGTSFGFESMLGRYWSSSCYNLSNNAYNAYFGNGYLDPYYSGYGRYIGCSVRLVRNVE